MKWRTADAMCRVSSGIFLLSGLVTPAPFSDCVEEILASIERVFGCDGLLFFV
jgi:hypothetical protein